MTSNLKQIIGYVKENPKTYTIVSIISAFMGMLEFLGVGLILPVVSVYLGDNDVSMPSFIMHYTSDINPSILLLVFSILIIVQSLLSIVIEGYFVSHMSIWRTEFGLAYLKAIINSKLNFFQKLKLGEAEVVISRNIGFSMKNRLTTAILMSDAILAFIYMFIALYITVYSLILFLVLLIAYYVIHTTTTQLKTQYSVTAKKKYFSAAKHISEYLSDIRSVHIYKKSNFFEKSFSYLDGAAIAQKKTDIINSIIKHTYQPIMMVLIVLTVIVANTTSILSNSEILIVLFVFYRAAPKMVAVARAYGEIISNFPYDINCEISNWSKHEKTKNSSNNIPEKFEIKFINTTIKFGKNIVLSKVNATFPDQALTTIIGQSGSGKSTMIDVILKLVSIESGHVTVGGVDIENIDYDVFLPKNIAIVSPRAIVLSSSILRNITYLDDNVDVNFANEVAIYTGVNDIMVGRSGIETVISSHGENLSTGQKQRLILARALYKKPKILILDEPTSNLDKDSEAVINSIIERLKKEILVIVVTHRKGVLEISDKIYKISNKCLEEIKQ
jgi:ATP-binding cassette, subfamily C, bacterial